MMYKKLKPMAKRDMLEWIYRRCVTTLLSAKECKSETENNLIYLPSQHLSSILTSMIMRNQLPMWPHLRIYFQ